MTRRIVSWRDYLDERLSEIRDIAGGVRAMCQEIGGVLDHAQTLAQSNQPRKTPPPSHGLLEARMSFLDMIDRIAGVPTQPGDSLDVVDQWRLIVAAKPAPFQNAVAAANAAYDAALGAVHLADSIAARHLELAVAIVEGSAGAKAIDEEMSRSLISEPIEIMLESLMEWLLQHWAGALEDAQTITFLESVAALKKTLAVVRKQLQPRRRTKLRERPQIFRGPLPKTQPVSEVSEAIRQMLLGWVHGFHAQAKRVVVETTVNPQEVSFGLIGEAIGGLAAAEDVQSVRQPEWSDGYMAAASIGLSRDGVGHAWELAKIGMELILVAGASKIVIGKLLPPSQS